MSEKLFEMNFHFPNDTLHFVVGEAKMMDIGTDMQARRMLVISQGGTQYRINPDMVAYVETNERVC